MFSSDEMRQDIRLSRNIILFCRCSIRYSGRAESVLETGERIILIKQDGTLLVHQPSGSMPVNYMKESSIHTVKETPEGLAIESSHMASKEHLTIYIEEVYHYGAQMLTDTEKIQLAGTEKDMSDMIYNNPSLISADFKPISREERITYGFIDVFGYDAKNNLLVIECKRYTGDLKAVDQLERYVRKMKELKGVTTVKGILACPKISSTAQHMLESRGFSWCCIEPPNYLQQHKSTQKTLNGF